MLAEQCISTRKVVLVGVSANKLFAETSASFFAVFFANSMFFFCGYLVTFSHSHHDKNLMST